MATISVAEPSVLHRSSPCWEHRSFSEVVARNESPLLYSNIVSAKNNQQKQQLQTIPMYSESAKPCDSSVSTLGIYIGSNYSRFEKTSLIKRFYFYTFLNKMVF